jgi:RNA polymerase subunit RPABC4/transcription elongation factor Spt4
MSPARSKPSGKTTTCPWCSTTVPVEAATCPNCGAQLREAAEGDILGVTQIDPSAVSRIRRVKPRRLTSWITGESPEDEETEAGGKVEPPSPDVKREMLKMELAAIDAELEARAAQAAANRELPPEAAEPAETPKPAEPGPT